jgi:hypothetical protein
VRHLNGAAVHIPLADYETPAIEPTQQLLLLVTKAFPRCNTADRYSLIADLNERRHKGRRAKLNPPLGRWSKRRHIMLWLLWWLQPA